MQAQEPYRANAAQNAIGMSASQDASAASVPNDQNETRRNQRERRNRRGQNVDDDNPSSPSSDSSSNGGDHNRRNADGNNNRDRGRRDATYPSSQDEQQNPHAARNTQNPQRVGNSDNNFNNRQLTKTVPVNQWRISFSGDANSPNKHDVNIHKFLKQVSLFRRASKITENELLDQVIHLLSGNARDWYQNAYTCIRTWPQFANELRRKFLPTDYNYDLVAQANRRKQGKNESISSYINAMEMLFQAMSVPMAEHQQLYIVRSNLLQHYADIVAATNPQTIAEVEAVCKRLESSRKQQKENSITPAIAKPFRPKYGNVHAAEEIEENQSEPDEADDDDSGDGEGNNCAALRQSENRQKKVAKPVKGGDKPAKSNNGTVKENSSKVNNVEMCLNCKTQGHQQRDCKRKWKKHCYACGYEDVVARECPKCNPELAKNGQVNQLDGEQDDSQSDTAHQN